jgi:hypothetical protein
MPNFFGLAIGVVLRMLCLIAVLLTASDPPGTPAKSAEGEASAEVAPPVSGSAGSGTGIPVRCCACVAASAESSDAL